MYVFAIELMKLEEEKTGQMKEVIDIDNKSVIIDVL